MPAIRTIRTNLEFSAGFGSESGEASVTNEADFEEQLAGYGVEVTESVSFTLGPCNLARASILGNSEIQSGRCHNRNVLR